MGLGHRAQPSHRVEDTEDGSNDGSNVSWRNGLGFQLWPKPQAEPGVQHNHSIPGPWAVHVRASKPGHSGLRYLPNPKFSNENGNSAKMGEMTDKGEP